MTCMIYNVHVDFDTCAVNPFCEKHSVLYTVYGLFIDMRSSLWSFLHLIYCFFPTGEAHFNAYQKPLLYFQVLFLTGQFEAVSFLFQRNTLTA